MEEVPYPVCGNNDLLIRMKQTAICGTDVHIYNWDDWAQGTIPVPLVIGHEFVGVVEQVGKNVGGYKKGDRVSGEGHITCGYCRNCRAGKRHLCRNSISVGVQRPGAFAECLSLPAVNAFPIPESISDDLASILDPLGNACHTALSFDLTGEDVLITGDGPIGSMAVAICRHAGARHVVITGLSDERLAIAKACGADLTVNIQKESLGQAMEVLHMLEGFDVGLEMSGSVSALESMIDLMNHGGQIALLGIYAEANPLPLNKVIFKGLRLKGIYGREMFETWYKTISMLESGLNIDPVITDHLPVDEFQKGFEIMKSGKSGKVILRW
jgi:threonine 3-dehydrogenase